MTKQDDLLAAIHTNVLAIGKSLGVDLENPESSRAALEEKARKYHSPGGAGYTAVYGSDEERAKLAQEAEEVRLAEADAHYVEEVGVEEDPEPEGADEEVATGIPVGQGDEDQDAEEGEEKSKPKSKSK